MSLKNESRIKVNTITSQNFTVELTVDEARSLSILLGSGTTSNTIDLLDLRKLQSELSSILNTIYTPFVSLAKLENKPVL